MDNVNEVLEMIDREGVEQGQPSQANEGYEDVETLNRESNDQESFSEPEQEPGQLIEPELYWDEELEYEVEV